MAEKEGLLQAVAACDKAKAEQLRKIKQLQDAMRDEIELRDRELLGLRNALKKANEDNEASLDATKEEVRGHVSDDILN